MLSASVCIGLLAGGGVYAFKTPVYLANAQVQVEEQKGALPGLDELADLMATQSTSDTEIEVLRSRTLIGEVVDELKLDVIAKPKYFPVVGRAIARWRDDDSPAPALLRQHDYAWGGERIALASLDVPQEWLGETLELIVGDNGHYEVYRKGQIFGRERQLVATGVVGEPSTPAPGVKKHPTLLVRTLIGRPGTEFQVMRDERLTVIETLQANINITEKVKKSGVLLITLEGQAPKATARLLDTMEKDYLRQNVARKTAELEHTLQFIDSQLPELKSRLEAAEVALNRYRTTTGTIDVGLETKANLDAAALVETRIGETMLQLDEAKARFTENHPLVEVLKAKHRRLEGERKTLETRFKKLPASELESARLLRDVRLAQDLYVLLLNKSQELKVMKSGTIGTVRILDQSSVPVKPVAPTLPITLGLGLFGGLLLGVGAAFAKKALHVGVEDPELLEAELGLPVYASIPHSRVQQKRVKSKRRAGAVPILAVTHPNDLSIEALRSMRTGLQFALAEADNNVVAVGGPSPSIGKSFVSVNLAYVLADAGQRVLLIDADLRKGRLHDYFGGARCDGLAELLAEGGSPERVISESTSSHNLSFMSMGRVPAHPSELLGSDRYEEVIKWASSNFDVVVIDCPPILAVTDGALSARVAGTNFVVLRSGQHHIREVSATLKRLAHAHIKVKALILNDVKADAGTAYGQYGYHYNYEYR
jgi:tyrosine-protein kinase Etk/Wzc